MTNSYYVRVQTARPPYSSVGYFLWGTDASFDSDGNALFPTDSDWTKLTLLDRTNTDSRVDIHPVLDDPLTLELTGKPIFLAARAAYYISMATNGTVSHSPIGPFSEPKTLESELGEFDLEAALWNASFL
jgi:hypothetical protein